MPNPNNDMQETPLVPICGPELRIVGYLNTLWAAVGLLIVLIPTAIFLLATPFVWPPDVGQNSEIYYILLYVQVGIFFLMQTFVWYIQRRHNAIRIEGYLEFFIRIEAFPRLVHLVDSVFTALMLLLASIINNYYGHNLSSPLRVVCSAEILEIVMITIALCAYIVDVHDFNSKERPPDVLMDEWMSTLIHDCFSAGEVGLRRRNIQKDELLARQSEFLRCLNAQKVLLAQELLKHKGNIS